MSVSFFTGTVIKTTGSYHTVRTDGGEMIICGIKGLFRMKGIRTTNPVAVGDRVDGTCDEPGKGIITKIHQRKNYIIRKATKLKKAAQMTAVVGERTRVETTVAIELAAS